MGQDRDDYDIEEGSERVGLQTVYQCKTGRHDDITFASVRPSGNIIDSGRDGIAHCRQQEVSPSGSGTK